MKIMIMVVAALAILGGGGAGAYFYFMKPAEASEGEAAKKDVHAEKAASKDDHKEKSHGEHMEFVELDPLILPIIDDEGVNQIVSVVVAIEVGTPESAATVKTMTPRLKDAYIQELYGVLNKHAGMKGGVIQVGMMKERLNKISTKVLGEDVVNDVLLQVVQQNPI